MKKKFKNEERMGVYTIWYSQANTFGRKNRIHYKEVLKSKFN